MTVGSLFSGIGGFELGLERAGIGPVRWQVEIDKACRRVLEHHWPIINRYEDIKNVGAHNCERVDVICGGFPCQDLSIAGRRMGLKGGERSGLFYEMMRIIDELKPAYVLWENVCGLSSSDDGRDLARILLSLVRSGYSGCGRILDAQYFGLAQRRERWIGVFARGDIGAECCAEILSLSEGMRWHPAPSREARKGITGTPENRTGAGGFPGTDGVTSAITSKWFKGTGGPAGDEVQNLAVCAPCSPPITSNQYGDHESREGLLVVYRTAGNCGPFEMGDKTGCLNTATDPNQNIVVFQPRIGRNGRGYSENIVPTLNGAEAGATSDMRPCVVYDISHGDDPIRKCGELAPSLQYRMGTGGNQVPVIQSDFEVRRLTPTECERLQGFPDGWTAGESDSARYRMLGNAVAVPVAEWIGKRMAKLNQHGGVRWTD